MKTPAHLLLGAAVAALPDIALVGYGWRRTHVPETHPLVRLHHRLHRPSSVLGAAAAGAVLFGAAWASHVYSDRHSAHPLPRWVR